ncbi:MAG: hypothetical protein IPN90_12960, partial [Elusimicrobia bacterium]|nr:hypothetical protein [Elusimicrobiota bacterium]
MKANFYYTLAGSYTSYGGDGGPAISALFNNVRDLTVDTTGNVYIADAGNHRIRFIARTSGTYFGQMRTANYIYTIAGTGTRAGSIATPSRRPPHS